LVVVESIQVGKSSLTGSGDVREVAALLPPVDILRLLLTSMLGRREWSASNDLVRYLLSNDGDATGNKSVTIRQ
jgi:hypothetical protein